MGGLSRRSTQIQKLRGEGTVFVADAGDLYSHAASLPADQLPQAREKAKLQAEVYAKAGIDFMAPGEGDLALGWDFVAGLAKERSLPYVAANLECGGSHPFPASKVVERGGIRMAAVGILPADLSVPGCTTSPPGQALADALKGLDADVIVVLSGESATVTERLLDDHPEVDVLLAPDNKQLSAAELLDSGALRVGAGTRGRQLGALHLTLVPGAQGWRDEGALGELAERRDNAAKRLDEARGRLEKATTDQEKLRTQTQVDFYGKQVADYTERLSRAGDEKGTKNLARHQLLPLDTAVVDDPEVAALVSAAKDRIAAAAPKADDEARYDGPYQGAERCAACHPAETAQWKATPHAEAWAALVNVKRQLDQECWSCHVTGAGQPEGPRHPGEAMVAGLVNVGCESCHGPGKQHLAAPAAALAVAPTKTLCETCHDGVKDEGRFDFDTYLPKVVHSTAQK